MFQDSSDLIFNTNATQMQKTLPVLKEQKKWLQDLKNLSDFEVQFKTFEKIILAIWQKEVELFFSFEEKSKYSLYDKLNLIREYNELLLSFKQFDDDLFIVNILKKTNSPLRPVFLEACLRMRENILEKKKKNSKDVCLDSDETSFEWQVENQPHLVEFKEDFDLYPLSLNMSEQQFFYNKEKSFEDLKPLNLEDMCQIFLDIVQKRCDLFKQNENLDWDTAQNRQSVFQKFFKELFEEVLFVQDKILKKEQEGINKNIQISEADLFNAVSKSEKSKWGDLWQKFSLSVQLQDIMNIHTDWRKLKTEISLPFKLETAYAAYLKFLLKKHLFVSDMPLEKIPVEPDKFLYALNRRLAFEKAYLKKLMKFILKNAFIIFMPYVSGLMLKVALSEMNKMIHRQLDVVEQNLFLLYHLLLKDLNLTKKLEKSEKQKELTRLLTNLTDGKVNKLSGCINKIDINAIDCKGRTLLFHAVCNENENLVKSILALNPDIEKSDYKKQTPLMKAFEIGNKKIIKLLLGKNASLSEKDVEGKTIFHFAVLSPKDHVFEFLDCKNQDLNEMDENKQTPLHLAIQKDNFGAFKFLLANGADPYLLNEEGQSCASLIQKKSQNYKNFFARYESQRKIYECLLFQGILTNNLPYVEKAIEKKAHLNEIYLYQKTPIEWALTFSYREAVVLLMKNNCFCRQNRIKNLGYLELRQALLQQDMKYFKILLKAGADVNSIDEKTKLPLLHLAVLVGYHPFVEVMIENNVDLNLKDAEGKTFTELSKNSTRLKSFFKN